MPELLFRLRNVPDDEADDIRQLLSDNEIDFYETHTGTWSVSMPGIWLNDESRLQEAQALLHEYQVKRAATAREAYEQLKLEGRHPTLSGRIAAHPIRFLMLLFALAIILYITLSPFIEIGK